MKIVKVDKFLNSQESQLLAEQDHAGGRRSRNSPNALRPSLKLSTPMAFNRFIECHTDIADGFDR